MKISTFLGGAPPVTHPFGRTHPPSHTSSPTVARIHIPRRTHPHPSWHASHPFHILASPVTRIRIPRRTHPSSHLFSHPPGVCIRIPRVFVLASPGCLYSHPPGACIRSPRVSVFASPGCLYSHPPGVCIRIPRVFVFASPGRCTHSLAKRHLWSFHCCLLRVAAKPLSYPMHVPAPLLRYRNNIFT